MSVIHLDVKTVVEQAQKIAQLEKQLNIAIKILTKMSETDCLGWEQYAENALKEIEEVSK